MTLDANTQVVLRTRISSTCMYVNLSPNFNFPNAKLGIMEYV